MLLEGRPDPVYRVAQEWAAWDDLSSLVLEGLLLEIACQVMRRASARSGPQWIRRAKNVLQEGFLGPIRLDALSREFGHPPFSPS
jgi:hypothetical protein